MFQAETKLCESGKRKGQLLYAKENVCFFCEKIFSNIQKHLEQKHSSQKEVKIISKLQKNSIERLNAQAMLRNKGNFAHNVRVLKAEEGELFVVRRPEETCSAELYLPCPDCYGFYMSYDLWKHKCPGRKGIEAHQLKQRGKILLIEATSSALDEDVKDLLSKISNPTLKDLIAQDDIIKKFVAYLVDKHSVDTKKQDAYIRERARNLGRFMLCVQEEPDLSNAKLFDILSQPKLFDIAVKCALLVSETSVELCRKIGHSIRKCLTILRGIGMRTADYELLSNVKLFDDLMATEWSDRVSSKSLKKQYQAKLNKMSKLPSKEDILKLSDGISREFEQALAALEREPFIENWRRFAEILLAKIVFFNKRRAGEASRMKITDYQAVENRLNNQIQAELFDSLTEEEKKIASKHLVVYTPGKRGRHVPTIITLEMKRGIDFLIQSRRDVGIKESNPFIFAMPHKDTELQAWNVIRKLSEKLGVKNCQSTNLRKYLATTIQTLGFKDSDLDSVAHHLGHDIRIHREFYRMDDATIELAKISKLLHLSERGELHKNKGKTLEDLEFALSSSSEESDGEDAGSDDSDHDPSKRNGRAPTRKGLISKQERNEIIAFFEKSIQALKLPLKKNFIQYISQKKSHLEWTQIKAVIVSRINTEKNKQKKAKQI